MLRIIVDTDLHVAVIIPLLNCAQLPLIVMYKTLIRVYLNPQLAENHKGRPASPHSLRWA